MYSKGTSIVIGGQTVLAHAGTYPESSVPTLTIADRVTRIIDLQQTCEDVRLVKQAIERGQITLTGVRAQNLVFALTILHEHDFVSTHFPRVDGRPTNSYGEGEV